MPFLQIPHGSTTPRPKPCMYCLWRFPRSFFSRIFLNQIRPISCLINYIRPCPCPSSHARPPILFQETASHNSASSPALSLSLSSKLPHAQNQSFPCSNNVLFPSVDPESASGLSPGDPIGVELFDCVLPAAPAPAPPHPVLRFSAAHAPHE